MLSVSALILPVIDSWFFVALCTLALAGVPRPRLVTDTYKIKNEYIRLLVPDIEVHGSISLMMPRHRDLITHNLHTMGLDHFPAEAGSTRTNWR